VGILVVLSARAGDDQTQWDAAAAATGDAEAVAAVAEANRLFAERRALGDVAVKLNAGRLPERTERFDVEAEEIILFPPVVGG